MNCDQVFDVLTRESFPTGNASDLQVEAHLQSCHDCRQLAEALRPAVELFHESLPAADCAKLPGYRGGLADQPASDLPRVVDALIRQPPSIPSTSSTRGHGRWSRARWASSLLEQSAITALLVGVACSLFWYAGLQGTPDRPATAALVAPELSDFVPREPGALAALRLPVACSGGGLHIGAEYHCCTRCHSAALRGAPRVRNVAAVWAACGTCHPSHLSVVPDRS